MEEELKNKNVNPEDANENVVGGEEVKKQSL